VIWRLTRAGVHTTRALGARGSRASRPALVAAGAVAIGYALLGALAAVLVSAGGLRVSPLRALLTFGAVAALAALAGALRTTGAIGKLTRRAPAVLRDGVRTGLVAGPAACGRAPGPPAWRLPPAATPAT
jgi:hypothetical protein